MSHVLLITWGGDFQGTAIVRKLKDYIYNKYVQKVCSEEAAEAIYKDILKERDRLCELMPRCKKPEIIFRKPVWAQDGYLIALEEKCNTNNVLLQLKISSTMFIVEGQDLWDAVGDVTELEG